MRRLASGEPIMAPPPKPMIAIPVAIPRRSGNHLMSVETGEMYPSPRPTPPITPEPTHSNQIWWTATPSAEMTRPPHQQTAATTPALRGPARSSQPPQIAAADPRNTKNSVNIQPSEEIFQSQFLAISCWPTSSQNPSTLPQEIDSLIPMARDSGSQNTEKP